MRIALVDDQPEERNRLSQMIQKMLFILLILSNIANLVVVILKCIEGFLAPRLAL